MPSTKVKSKSIATATELNIRAFFLDKNNILNERNEKDSISLTMTYRLHARPMNISIFVFIFICTTFSPVLLFYICKSLLRLITYNYLVMT